MERIRRFVAPSFNGEEKSYPFWRRRMEHYLMQEELFYTLDRTPEEEDYAIPLEDARAETERKAKFAKRIKDERSTISEFYLALGDDAMGHILDCTTAKEILCKLDEVYLPQGSVAMLGLRSKLYLLKNENLSSLHLLFAAHEDILRQLNNMGEQISHEEQINTLLTAIPDQFKHLLSALSVLRKDELNKMSLHQIKRIFLDSDSQDSNTAMENKAVALVGGPGKLNGKKKQKPRYSKTIVCFGCGKVGHKRQNCLESKRKEKKSNIAMMAFKDSNRDPRIQKRITEKIDELKQDPKCPASISIPRQNGSFVVKIPLERIELCSIGKIRHERNDPWCQPLKDAVVNQLVRNLPIQDVPLPWTNWPIYLDSGASRHMVREMNAFNQIWDTELTNIETARMGDELWGDKEGNVNIVSFVGDKKINITLYNVLYVPKLTCNLLSVSQLESTGKSVIFKNGHVTILDEDGTVIAHGNKSNGVYCLNFALCTNAEKSLAVKTTGEDFPTWHRRYGHLGESNLVKLTKFNMVDGLKIRSSNKDKNAICESCVIGRQTRESFIKDKTFRSKRPLEIVHTDVCGPISTPTYDGYRYFVSFIDDFTHFVVVYLIRTKCEVLQKFKEYEAMATAHLSYRIAKLRSDNGSEYYSKEFVNFCRDKGIQMIATVPYTPEQNGVSERMNRTLMEKARTIIHESNIPYILWGEALYVSTYVTNRSPTSALLNTKTPYEMWFNSKPDVSKLKVFGCLAYSHINKVHRRKLDKKSELLAMVGYAPNGFRLWNDHSKEIIISRDVVFDEAKFYFRDTNRETESKQLPDEVVVDLPNQHYTEFVPVATNESDEEEFHEVAEDLLEDESEISHRRTERIRKQPGWMSEYETSFLTLVSSEEVPQTIHELSKRDDWVNWKKAIEEELKSLVDNNTWTIVDKVPCNRKAINSMWIFTVKDNVNSPRYKARLVAKGCSQRPGMDYSETFAPVAKMSAVRTLLSIAVHDDLYVHQMDVKTAFLYGLLEEEIYMKLPIDEQGTQKICKLNRTIYGLKQASRSWNTKFNQIITSLGFISLKSDCCIYFIKSRNIYLVLYVDDILIFGKHLQDIEWIKDSLSKNFKMKDMGNVENFLGLEIRRSSGILEITQQSYIEKILRNYGMQDCKPVSTPIACTLKWSKEKEPTKYPFKALLGSLQYLALMSRPDICFAINVFSQFQSNPTDEHWSGLKRVLRYLQGSKSSRLVYRAGFSNILLTGYADADFGNDHEERRSISGSMFTVFGNAVSWSTRKQSLVVLSSTEAEYVSLCEAAKEGIWLSQLLNEIDMKATPFVIHEDNIPCINIAEEPRHHQRTKHIDIKYMFLRF